MISSHAWGKSCLSRKISGTVRRWEGEKVSRWEGEKVGRWEGGKVATWRRRLRRPEAKGVAQIGLRKRRHHGFRVLAD